MALLSKDATKEQEIQFINKLAKTVEPGTYLSNLFTPKLITWVEQAIKNDFPPDLFEWYEKVCEELTDQRTETEAGYKQFASVKEQLDQAIQLVKEKDERLTKSMQQTEDALQVANDRYNEWVKKDDEVTTLKAEIIHLKAKLYDLMAR